MNPRNEHGRQLPGSQGRPGKVVEIRPNRALPATPLSEWRARGRVIRQFEEHGLSVECVAQREGAPRLRVQELIRAELRDRRKSLPPASSVLAA